jgi:hypothetical protein
MDPIIIRVELSILDFSWWVAGSMMDLTRGFHQHLPVGRL